VNNKEIRVPSPEHPITIERNDKRVVVSISGRIVADNMSLLESTDHSTYCPYKGDCSYFSIPVGGNKSVNAVWTYESPYDSVAAIEGHLAFYRDRVDSIEENAA